MREFENKLILPSIAITAACGMGFAGGQYYWSTYQSEGESRDNVAAHCSVFASEEIRASSVKIKCGLDQKGIEKLVNEALSGLDLTAFNDGDNTDNAAMEEAAARLGLTAEALLAHLKEGGDQKQGNKKSTSTPLMTEVLLDVRHDQLPRNVSSNSNAKRPIQLSHFEVVNAASEEVIENVTRNIVLDCALAAKNLAIEEVSVECGPDQAEIDTLIEQIVSKSGARDIKMAIQKDETAKSQLINLLSKYYMLEDQIVTDLVQRMASTNSTWSGETTVLDAALRDKMRRTLAVVRIGQLIDQLNKDQKELAGAVAIGNDDNADRIILGTGGVLRPAADEFSPLQEPNLVGASRLITAANEENEKEEFGLAADTLLQASSMLENEYPLIADIVSLKAVEAVERSDLNIVDFIGRATDIRLAAADRLARIAIDAGIEAAFGLREHGAQTIGDIQLQQAVKIIERLAMLVNPETDLERYVTINGELSRINLQLGVRGRNARVLENSEAAAHKALEGARLLSDFHAANALLDLGNIQLSLAELKGETHLYDDAEKAYQEAVDLTSSEKGLAIWAPATHNLAIVKQKQAYQRQDPKYLEDAIAIYRDLIPRGGVDGQLVRMNLGKSLVALGDWKGESRNIREALSIYAQILGEYENEGQLRPAIKIELAMISARGSLGRLEKVDAEFIKAKKLISKVRQREGISDAVDLSFSLVQESARLHNSIGETLDKPDEFLAAAKAYAELRSYFHPETFPLDYAKFAVSELEALANALQNGSTLVDRAKATVVVEIVLDLVEKGKTDGPEESWTSIGQKVEALSLKFANE